MSYIAVDDIAATVEIARARGGMVEIGPEPFESGGQFALIRDPLGASFTVYQGDALSGVTSSLGARVGHGLFVSDISAVRTFYETLFGWQIVPYESGVHVVRHHGETIAYAHDIPDPGVRGAEEYGAVFFASRDLRETKERIKDAVGDLGGHACGSAGHHGAAYLWHGRGSDRDPQSVYL